MCRYLSSAETNKLIRKALKSQFPGVKFSVKGDRASRINWVDGPESFAVDAFLAPFRNGGFDASIDMAYHSTSYILADGSVTSGKSSGTAGSRGYAEAYAFDMPEGAEEVSFGASHIFTTREISPEFEAKCERAFAQIGSNARVAFRMNARLRQWEGGETDGHFLARNIAA